MFRFPLFLFLSLLPFSASAYETRLNVSLANVVVLPSSSLRVHYDLRPAAPTAKPSDAAAHAVSAPPPFPTPTPPIPLDYDTLQRLLWNAAANGDAVRVKELLQQGANPTELRFGRTYLDIAAQNSLFNRFSDLLGLENPWISVIEVLLDYGADPAQSNAAGRTPYEHYREYVLWYPHPEIQRLLATPSNTQKVLQNLLRFAVQKGDPARVEMRIEQGADPCALSYGKTFLELAARNSAHYAGEWIRVIRVLLKHGADPYQTNDDYRTAYDSYQEMGSPNPEIAFLLA
jgi:ankyrin repeat protein